jgi:hypothetical protein
MFKTRWVCIGKADGILQRKRVLAITNVEWKVGGGVFCGGGDLESVKAYCTRLTPMFTKYQVNRF